ncbi:MAG: tetratricopeptide repeat protein [Thermodesulfobacteriota bacterium]|nr:tetratricopeptide repeat protein [Thermodesulfobacteriota bacterium]
MSIPAVTFCLGRSNGFFCFAFLLVLFVQGIAAAESYEADVLKSASAGDSQSQFALALLYEYGSDTFTRNPEQSIFWLEKAGHEAVAGACLYLGMKYEYGNRVAKDLSKAACWYSCAARQDWPAAQFFLAALYEHGKGVELSPYTALAWFGMAAEYGYPGAEEAFLRLLKATAYENMEELSKKQEMLLQEDAATCN